MGLRLELRMLDRGSLEIVFIEKILRRLFLFHKSDWKVIDLIA